MENESDTIILNETQRTNIKGWINHGWKLTVDLVKLDQNNEPCAGFCSGFLMERNGKLYVVSAGHGLGNGEWYFQTHVSDDNSCETALIPMKGVFTLHKVEVHSSGAASFQPIDFAWCEISFSALAKDMKKKPYLIEGTDFLKYTGPLDGVPVGDLPYTYAAHNRREYSGALGRNLLELGGTYESCMTYDGIDSETGWYRFALARKHQGHSYYKGASGSPIFEPEGRIVSILLYGDKDNDILFGLPLNQYQACIGLL